MSRTILVVDDDPLIRRLVATTLEDVSGFDLVEAGDGVEALERAAAENTLRTLRGEEPLYVKNPAVLPRWRERLAHLGHDT